MEILVRKSCAGLVLGWALNENGAWVPEVLRKSYAGLMQLNSSSMTLWVGYLTEVSAVVE